jgi:RND family efflux transporter MFP subunit
MIKTIRKIILITTAVFIITAMLNLLACRAIGDGQEDTETFEVIRGDVIQTVNTSGYVLSELENSYSLMTSGKVAYCLEKGGTFKKDDILIEIDTSRQQLLVAQAEENLTVAENSLSLARLNYQQALDANHIALQMAEENKKLSELAVQNALTALEDANEYLSLVEEGVLSTDILISQASAQSHSAEGLYNQAILNQSTTYWTNLSSTQSAARQIEITAKNIAQAESQLQLSKINLDLVNLDLDNSIIYAPYDGTVLSSAYREGEFAGPGVPAISVISSVFIIKAEINETDMVNLKVGQDVAIRLDAYFENEFEGKITEISPISTNIGGVVSFEIIVKPDAADVPTLLYGLSASLDIVTSSAEDVLYAPIQSVFEEDGKSYVNIRGENDEVEKVEVTTGIYNFDFIEIKSGLSEGDTILISPMQ